MKKIFFFSVVMPVLFGQVFLSCKKEKNDSSTTANNQPPVSNRPPIANAGADQTITLPLNVATLDGSDSSDPDSNIVRYSWAQISGPSTSTIVTRSAKKTQVNGLLKGVYQFELTVTDGAGLSAKDTIAVTVRDAAVVSDCSYNHWTQLQYLPADEFFFGPRYWFDGDDFLMGIDSAIYAVSNKGNVWKYSIESNTWSYKSNFPEQTSALPVTFNINGKGYCYVHTHCWQYTPSTNQWEIKADPPGRFSFSAPLVINEKVYLRNMNNDMVEYDPVSDSYSVKKKCPSSEVLLGWFVINGYGFHVYKTGECWQYDAGTDTWHQKTSLNTPGEIFNTASFAVNGSGYVMGDLNLQAYNFNEPMKLVRYDFASDKWSQCATDYYPGNGAYHISAISFKGMAYVGLGYNNGDFNAIDFWKFQ